MSLITRPQYNPDFEAQRWFCYFDLLGIKNLAKHGIPKVFRAYSKAIEHMLKDNPLNIADLDFLWFSDTFVAFTESNDGDGFARASLFARKFMYFLVEARIPVRGAMACGSLYADKQNRILIGEPLIEAHTYGESQNWIGFILCPSAEQHLKNINFPIETQSDFVRWPIPYKKGHEKSEPKLGACRFGRIINGRNQSVRILTDMMNRNLSEYVKKKYSNTIAFLEQHR